MGFVDREHQLELQKALVTVDAIRAAHKRLEGIAIETPLTHSSRLSNKHGARIWLKDERLQPVRSYKLRGAANRMALLDDEERERGVVTASAGNHAQGVAFSADRLGVMADIVMPVRTPRQKVARVRHFGGDRVRIHLEGDTFDESSVIAQAMCAHRGAVYIPPFNDPHVIAGQGTVGLEILRQADEMGFGNVDVVVVPLGGGGLISGVGTYFRQMSPDTEIIGVEPAGAAAMHASLRAGELVTLNHINPFVDGAAVKTPGDLTFSITQDVVDRVVVVEEGQVCQTMVEMVDNDGMLSEPAGALSIAALNLLGNDIAGKNVVSIVSGANIGSERMHDIYRRAEEERLVGLPTFGVCV